MSERQLKKLTLAVAEKEKEIEADIKDLKDFKDESKTKKTLISTIRSWTNAQIAIIRGFLFLVMGMVARDSFLEHSAGINVFDVSAYTELGILILLIGITFLFERHNNSVEDQREQAKNEARMKNLAQHFAIQYFFGTVLRQKNLSLEDTIDLLKQAPKIITMVNPSRLAEDVNNGFTMVADAMNSITLNFRESYNKIESKIASVNDNIESKITSALSTLGIVQPNDETMEKLKDMIKLDLEDLGPNPMVELESVMEDLSDNLAELEEDIEEDIEYIDEE